MSRSKEHVLQVSELLPAFLVMVSRQEPGLSLSEVGVDRPRPHPRSDSWSQLLALSERQPPALSSGNDSHPVMFRSTGRGRVCSVTVPGKYGVLDLELGCLKKKWGNPAGPGAVWPPCKKGA